MINKYLGKLFFNKATNLLNEIKIWVISWVKEWVYRQLNQTLIITDDNWSKYITDDYYLSTYYYGDEANLINKTISQASNLKTQEGSNGDMWLIGRNSDYLANMCVVYDSSYNDDTTGHFRPLTREDVITATKDKNNTKIFTVKRCRLKLKKSIRTVQFATQFINFSGISIIPPNITDDSDRLSNIMNGYKITTFLLPTDGLDSYSDKNLFNSIDKYIPRHVSIGINEISVDRAREGSTSPISTNCLWIGGMVGTRPNSYRNEFSKTLDDIPVLTTSGEDTIYQTTSGNCFNDYKRFCSLEGVSTLHYITIPDYRSAGNQDTGRSTVCVMKPGRVIDLMWFNGFWYAMGPR